MQLVHAKKVAASEDYRPADGSFKNVGSDGAFLAGAGKQPIITQMAQNVGI